MILLSVATAHSLLPRLFFWAFPRPAIVEWYRDYWKQSGLQATSDDIERLRFLRFLLSSSCDGVVMAD
jgi:hypothetical protein